MSGTPSWSSNVFKWSLCNSHTMPYKCEFSSSIIVAALPFHLWKSNFSFRKKKTCGKGFVQIILTSEKWLNASLYRSSLATHLNLADGFLIWIRSVNKLLPKAKYKKWFEDENGIILEDKNFWIICFLTFCSSCMQPQAQPQKEVNS